MNTQVNLPNAYGKQLSDEEIKAGVHRHFVGGMWEEIGKLQFNFLVKHGLKSSHKLLDVGCGALRGGIHFIRYLEPENYYGLDINESLINAGKYEIKAARLEEKGATLLVDNQFNFRKFGKSFDFAIALSVFTHLPMNNIVRCLKQIFHVLHPESIFYATFFQANETGCLSPITHHPGQIVSQYDSDPFHYSFTEIKFLSDLAYLNVELIGDWGHPRNQKLLAFTHKR